MVTVQLARRDEVRVYANGAIEAPIQVVREGRLNINKVTSQDIYSTANREHLESRRWKTYDNP